MSPSTDQVRIASAKFWVVLILGVLAIYLPGLDNELIFDDEILENGYIFATYGGLDEFQQRLISYGSFSWIHTIFGEDWWKQRLVNLGIHIAVVVALYALIARLLVTLNLTAVEQPSHESRLAAAQVAVAFFALNPVAVYAVAYLVQRSILLATLFVVLACFLFVSGLQRRSVRWHILALICYAMAVLSKEHALSAGLLAIPLYVLIERPKLRALGQLLLACSVIVALAVVPFWDLYAPIIGNVFDPFSENYALQLEELRPGASSIAFPLSIINQASLFFAYGFLWVVPNVAWMSIDLRPEFPLSLFSFPQTIGAISYVAIVIVSGWAILRRPGIPAVMGLFALFPAILFISEFSTVWIQDPFVLYRSYLWAIGIPGLVAVLLMDLRPKTIYLAGLVIGIILAGLAFERTLSLRDELSVWNDAVAKVDLNAPTNAFGRWRPYLNRGNYYLEAGVPELAYRDFSQAELLGDFGGSARFSMGMSLKLMNRQKDAIDAFNLAEQRGFSESALYLQRAEALAILGRFGEARRDFGAALASEADPEQRRRLILLKAEVALKERAYAEAIVDFKALVKETPDSNRLLVGLGMAYVGNRQLVESIETFSKVLAHDRLSVAYYGRALARALNGDRAAALGDIAEAIDLEPENSIYQKTRDQILTLPEESVRADDAKTQ